MNEKKNEGPRELVPGKLYVLQSLEKLHPNTPDDGGVPFYFTRPSNGCVYYKNDQVVMCVQTSATSKNQYHIFLIDGRTMVPCSGIVLPNATHMYFKEVP